MKTYDEVLCLKTEFGPYSYKVGWYAVFSDWPVDYHVPRGSKAYGQLKQIVKTENDLLYLFEMPNGRLVTFATNALRLHYKYQSEDGFVWGGAVRY